MFTKGLHIIDWIIIVASLAVSIYVGAYFARRQKSTNAYFAASGSIPGWAVGMSILATLISSVTFLAYPEAGYQGRWILLVQAIAVVIVLLGLVWFVVPLFRRVIGISAYEYFEKRFGFFARLYTSFAFTLTHFAKMGTVFFLLGSAMAMICGFPGNKEAAYIVIWSIGFIIIVITLLGGIEAVIWLDVIQGFLLIVGGLISAAVLLFLMPGGVSGFLDFVGEHRTINFAYQVKAGQPVPDWWDLGQLTFLVMFLNGVFYGIQKYGTDQTIVQRYMTARSTKSAVKAGLMGVLLSLPVWALFMLIGTLLLAYYQLSGDPLPEGVKDIDVFLVFIMNKLPIGVSGLIISALVAAAFSSLDSDMNCLSAVAVEDYYARLKPKSSDRQRLRVGKLTVVLSGIASLGVASLYVALGGKGVLGIVFGLYAIFSGGIVGIFLLGLLSRRANKEGLYVAIAVCVVFSIYAVLTSFQFPIGPDGAKQVFLDLGKWNFPHHKYMMGVYTHLIILVVGYLASFLFPKREVDDHLTIWGHGKEILVSAGLEGGKSK